MRERWREQQKIAIVGSGFKFATCSQGTSNYNNYIWIFLALLWRTYWFLRCFLESVPVSIEINRLLFTATMLCRGWRVSHCWCDGCCCCCCHRFVNDFVKLNCCYASHVMTKLHNYRFFVVNAMLRIDLKWQFFNRLFMDIDCRVDAEYCQRIVFNHTGTP